SEREEVPGVISDYFDGADYKAFKANNLFQSPEDIAIALYADGFVNQNKGKQELVILHVMVLNYDPALRYTDQYLFQLAVIPGKPQNLDSFLTPFVDEVESLGKYGLIVKKINGEVIKAKVHMVMATGDIPQAKKITKGTIFAKLPTMVGSSTFGLDEMHPIEQGMGRLVHKFIVLSNMISSGSTDKKDNSNNFRYSKKKNDYATDYTFKLDRKDLLDAGKCIENSRSKIPVSFQGSWDNLVKKTDGARAIDFIDFLLYALPTVFVPFFNSANTRKALLHLSRGCAIALQWELTEELIVEMGNCFSVWHNFLQNEVNHERLSVKIFTANNHYLTHIGFMIRRAGGLRVYSARSMERTIGRYSKLIKSRVRSGKNAGKVVERLSITGFLNHALAVKDILDVIQSNKTSLDDYMELSSSSVSNINNHQLWSPFSVVESELQKQLLEQKTFEKELQKYYTRCISSTAQPVQIKNIVDIVIAGRSLIFSQVYSSEMYRIKRGERSRGNHYVMFEVNVKR
ncbi:hypothetical protein ABG067_007792, partial [Albugo candida]